MAQGKSIKDLKRSDLEEQFLVTADRLNRANHQVQQLSIRLANAEQDIASLDYDNQNLRALVQNQQPQPKKQAPKKKKSTGGKKQTQNKKGE